MLPDWMGSDFMAFMWDWIMLAFFQIKSDSFFTKNLFCKEEIFDQFIANLREPPP